MSKLSTITVKFQGNKTVKYRKMDLVDIAESLLSERVFGNLEPLLIKLGSGKKLYFDKNVFQCYVDNEISTSEVIELTQCDNLYRNTKHLLTKDQIQVEIGELWKSTGNKLTLIDEDIFVTSKIDLELFQMVD